MLRGKTIITTQPADQAEELLMLLNAKGADAKNLPMIETRNLVVQPETMKQVLLPGNFSLLVFTSKKGVKGFFENLYNLQGNYNLPEKLELAVVGHTTGKELEKHGYVPEFVNPGTDAGDLANYLLENIHKTGNKILLVLSDKAPDYLEKTLAQKAFIKRINVYETILLKNVDEDIAGLIKEKRVDMCIFTSPSGFFAFLEVFGNAGHLKLAAIGSTTAKAIRDCGYDVTVTAPYPSGQSMAKAIEDYFSEK